MIEPIIVRAATSEDAELIADVSRQTFFETFAAQNTAENMEKFMQRQFSKDQLMAELADRANIFFLAYENKELAGYLKLRDGKNPEQLLNASAIEIVRIYSVTSKI